MQPNDLDVAAIHPRNGEKYSPNLHKFMTDPDRQITAKYARVYRDDSDTLWLGYIHDGLFNGARLMRVLCFGRKVESGCYGRQLGSLAEVPNFWPTYLAIGRCAIDSEHAMSFSDERGRWRVTGDTRECLWCGNVHQRRERYTETIPRERWVTGHNERGQGPAACSRSPGPTG